MTTIAYRAGIMAADSRAYAGNNLPIGSKHKIHRLKDGSLFGASSASPGVCEKLRQLVEEHGVEATLPASLKVRAIVVRQDETIFYLDNGDRFSGPITAEYIAIGSGDAYALGVMAIGGDPITAIKAACMCDAWSAPPIRVLALHGAGDRQIDNPDRIGASSAFVQTSPRKTRSSAA